MTGQYRGAVLKARPALQRWQDSPVTRWLIGFRWAAWLADGWRPTTAALAIGLVVLTVAAPWVIAVTAVAGAWAVTVNQAKTLAAAVAVAGLVAACWWTWAHTGTATQLTLIGCSFVWPVDALAGARFDSYRRRRWWCEFARGFPARFAIMAAKSTRIQGVIDGELQLKDGRRPILDHPAIARRPVFDGDTAWAICSVPPGRDAQALREVLPELAASFIRVQRLDYVTVDDYQTYGHLVVTFGPALLHQHAAPTPAPSPVARFAAHAVPNLAIAAGITAATWTAIT